MDNIWKNGTDCGVQIDPWGHTISTFIAGSIFRDALDDPYKKFQSRHCEGILKDQTIEQFNKDIFGGRIIFETQHFTIRLSDHGLLETRPSDSGMINVGLFTSSAKEIENFDEVVKRLTPLGKENTVFVLTSGANGINIVPIGSMKTALVRENYDWRNLEKYDRIVKELNTAEPFGRLVILSGPPGTGKTHMVRGIINELKDSSVIIMPARLIVEIDGPTLIPAFIDKRSEYGGSLTFIIEDADHNLVPRSTDNMSSISALLNYTDGIFGSMLDLRIIATTNADGIEIDSALTRPGRMLEHMSVENIHPEQASKIYNRLSGKCKTYTDCVPLAKIYADARSDGAEIFAPKKPTLGFLSGPRYATPSPFPMPR